MRLGHLEVAEQESVVIIGPSGCGKTTLLKLLAGILLPFEGSLTVCGEDPAKLWEYYIQLTEVEQAFKELKGDLAVRPIFHQRDDRIEAHIFVAFLAYCLQVTLKQRLRALAPGLTPRAALEKFSAIQLPA